MDFFPLSTAMERGNGEEKRFPWNPERMKNILAIDI